jgi:hypothetical protein
VGCRSELRFPPTLSVKKNGTPPTLLTKSARKCENCEKSPKVGKNGLKKLKADPKGSFERFLSL